MKLACESPADEQWRQCAEHPGRVDRESREEREDEEDRDAPMEESRIDRMAQQLILADRRAPERADPSSCRFVEALDDRARPARRGRGARRCHLDTSFPDDSV